jgi:hypothetical protein
MGNGEAKVMEHPRAFHLPLSDFRSPNSEFFPPLLSFPLMNTPQRLPHAYPFRFIARELGEVELSFAASSNDAVSRGGDVPPWVVLEALTQAAGLLAASGEGQGGVLVQASTYRCPRRVGAGDVLLIRHRLLKRMGPVVRVLVTARREGRLVARGILTLREGGG